MKPAIAGDRASVSHADRLPNALSPSTMAYLLGIPFPRAYAAWLYADTRYAGKYKMPLKDYQQSLLDDYAAYLSRTRELSDPDKAFRESTKKHFGQ